MRIVVKKGDITLEDVDAIVNAANEKMLGGGGVDGAIHRAAGPELLEYCRSLPEVRPGVRCPTGKARITPGFRLSAKWIIHTVGPIYRGKEEDKILLEAAFYNSLRLAEIYDVKTIAFPAISCGVYGYPHKEAAQVARGVVRNHVWDLREARFVIFADKDFEIWKEILQS